LPRYASVRAAMTASVSHLSQLHRRIVLSLLLEASKCPFGEKATVLTDSVCPSSVRSNLPLCASQSFTVLSALPLASILLCRSNATLTTQCPCPSSVRRSLPLRTSQSFTVLSALRWLASCLQIKRHATHPASVSFERAEQLARARLPELHRVVMLPLASVPPCGSNATLLTPLPCPLSVQSSLPERASHNFTV
jgi:hypothetical protein